MQKSYFAKRIITLLVFVPICLFATNKINEINKAIQENGAKWVAKTNPIMQLSEQEQQALFQQHMNEPEFSSSTMLTIQEDLPEKFDWRDNNGSYVTPVKNQHLNNQGNTFQWTFAFAAAVESWWLITNDKPDSLLDLSEQFMLSCFEQPLEGFAELSRQLHEIGIPPESCFPYVANGTLSCDYACDDWEEKTIKIPGFGHVTMDELNMDRIKSAIWQHPVIAKFLVYNDFLSYSSGVYEHVYGSSLGAHIVVIVGWDDAEHCWICKNCWGTDWGENGYFRIKYDQSNIFEYITHIWDSINEEQTLIVSPQVLDLDMTVGDSARENIMLTNFGQEDMTFYLYPKTAVLAAFFQSDSFNAWDGSSWWCHNEQACGYCNLWHQQMQLPEIDLSDAIAPKLSFMGFWELEPIPSNLPNIDGYDGFNVSISTDQGESFQTIYPLSPAYNCENLYAFQIMNEVWSATRRTPGWSGSSNGWIETEFDLSTYSGEKVIIRFNFASDFNSCTLSDANLYGLFLDNIQITDNQTILYENNGEKEISAMGVSGFKPAHWIKIETETGQIPNSTFYNLGLDINTWDLYPGQHKSIVFITANTMDWQHYPFTWKFTVNLNAQAAEFDARFQTSSFTNLPICLDYKPQCKIENIGLYDINPFDIIAEMNKDGETIRTDKIHVDKLVAQRKQSVNFTPLQLNQLGEYELQLYSPNLYQDQNPRNNRTIIPFEVSNLIDDFETETELWDCQGGWGIPSTVIGYNSTHSMHVNKGENYEDNMNATMTLKHPFNFKDASHALLHFQAKSTIYPGDLCYIELSSDGNTWIKADSIQKSHTWKELQLDLTPFINQGMTNMHLRFRFFSDDKTNRKGIYLDNIQLFASLSSTVKNNTSALLPKKFVLYQNYPNPFNPRTSIFYDVPRQSHISLKIYNTRGQLVQTLVQAQQNAGSHSVNWNGVDQTGKAVSSGVYLYVISAENKIIDSKKMMYLK